VPKFAELLKLPREPQSGKVDLNALLKLGVAMPVEVLEQVCWDHGVNPAFQKQYGHLELTTIKWELRSVVAAELINAGIYPPFTRWVDNVTDRIKDYPIEGWECIDSRQKIVAYWREHQTWMRLPVFLHGDLLGSSAALHLVEGHTRLGVLRGLVHHQVIGSDSLHQVWVGSSSSAPLARSTIASQTWVTR